jgi:hypothetical protein
MAHQIEPGSKWPEMGYESFVQGRLCRALPLVRLKLAQRSGSSTRRRVPGHHLAKGVSLTPPGLVLPHRNPVLGFSGGPMAVVA